MVDAVQRKKRRAANERKRYKRLSPDARRARAEAISEKRKEKIETVPGYRKAYNAWQRTYRCLRLPKWVKMDDFLDIYAEVERRGEDFVCDHIIPLRGKLVSGLHVRENLQIITRAENLKKRNKFEPYEE